MPQYWRVFALLAFLMAVGAYQIYGLFSNQGYMPQQPIRFSHVVHAGALQMECIYCHHQAEKGPYAGIPSVELCMGCHGQVKTDSPEIQKLAAYYEAGEPVPWVRIHKTPDHAYFSHQWHVAAGVACQECHGPIQSMPVVQQWMKLEMGDCMACHRQSNYVEQIFHFPTYHDPLFTDEAPRVAVTTTDSGAPGAYASVTRHLDKYYPRAMDEATARKVVASLNEYVDNIYIHGRAVQLRNQNAAVECSTCHY